MTDDEIAQRISRLVDEEHRLHNENIGRGLSVEEARRLEAVQVQLDQCWDLLRQRRALREMGENPDEADVRDGRTVEGYLQ